MQVEADSSRRSGSLWRSRWAAIGAAVAVTFGGGGLFVANAATSAPSSVVMIDPVRILDTRDPLDIGLPGPFVSAVSQKLQVTGAAVPAGATGVLLNVTVVTPTANGFLSIRPYDAYGVAGPSTEVLIDVVGYTADPGVYTKAEVDALLAGKLDEPKVLYAILNWNGPLDQGKGVVASSRADTGAYNVIFDRNISTCAAVATPADSTAAQVAIAKEVTLNQLAGVPNGFYVETKNSNGTPVDSAFTIVVVCP